MAETQAFVTLPLRCRCEQLNVSVDVPSSSLPLPLILCHCNTCNAVTGQLCATVCAVPEGSKPLDVKGTAKGYRTSGALERFFCENCGCSVYEDAAGMSPGLIFLDTGAFASSHIEVQGRKVPVFQPSEHIFVADTVDGGLRDWSRDMKSWEGWMSKSKEIPADDFYGPTITVEERQSQFVSSKDELQCGCHCGGVQFNITRPKDGSKHWPAPEQSEMLASPVTIPKSPEYMMQAEGAKYNAFLCACNDCRLSSGYEVSAWALIPNRNFRASDREPVSPQNIKSLESQSTMKDYESSSGCHRKFCGTCGATLSFSTNKTPNITNVSVGLMKAKTGCRREDWLQWQTDEIGYEALAQNKEFIATLAKGMKEWGSQRVVMI